MHLNCISSVQNNKVAWSVSYCSRKSRFECILGHFESRVTFLTGCVLFGTKEYNRKTKSSQSLRRRDQKCLNANKSRYVGFWANLALWILSIFHPKICAGLLHSQCLICPHQCIIFLCGHVVLLILFFYPPSMIKLLAF